MEIEEVFKTIDLIVQHQKKARARHDYNTLVVDAQALLEYMPALVNYAVDQEHEYRKFEAKLADCEENGKRLSSAYCETLAKATPEYRNWQKAKLFMDLMYEMVQLSKKLAGSVDKEMNAS